ncbi:MAG TPA: isoprenylcysteine carboxylmethyltransferase family protein [Vicinamibacterales bacterium]|nr:isoprenylcysteine carboxylmethyltransferase family protein [Vicinamibacterales bacterium]
MNVVAFVLAVVIGFMLAETRLSAAHERWLQASGAVRPDGDVYRTLAVVYPASFLVMGAEGLWRAAHAPAAATAGAPSWLAAGIVLFAASKALKYWAIRTLGERWSFRVYVQPGRPLVATGPYRYVAHPNYIAVMGEIAGTAMMVGAVVAGPIAIVVFAIVLRARIRFENRVLAESRASRAPSSTAQGRQA